MHSFPARLRFARILAIAITAAILTPRAAAAQTGARVAADRPSTSAETRRQSDSLTVHRLRTPKAKPVTRGTAAQRVAARKAAGDASGASALTPATTPLPMRSRRPKH
jgi:hypothetical protein